MKAIIIYNTKTGNTEEFARKMEDILKKYNFEVNNYRDKNIKSSVYNQEDFFDSCDLLCFGSCVHAMSAAFSFKKFLKKMPKQNLEGKKLICFATSGAQSAWIKACKKIQKYLPKCDHIGNIGCAEKENEKALKDFEELIKKYN